MKKSLVKGYASRLYKKLHDHGREMVINFDKESIHQFRVAYKKLRAFVRLVNEGPGKRILQLPKKLKRLYALAGAIREFQLNEERLQLAPDDDVQMLQDEVMAPGREMPEIKSALLEWMAMDVINKGKRKTINNVSAAVKLPVFAGYFANRCAAVRKLLWSVPLTDDQIHAIRKILKDLVYNLDVYEQENGFPPGTWKEKIAEYFDPLLEQLGGYQDICTALFFVESLWLELLGTKYREPLALLKDRWEVEKFELRQLLVTALQSEKVLATGRLEDIPISIHTEL